MIADDHPRLVLTVDVEDWSQSTWDHSLPIGTRCADQTLRLLELLADFPGARATFFVLGKFAERHPSVVAQILNAGHEVASHGYEHLEVFNMSPEHFADDLQRSAEAIESACGQRPLGHRAADFSIVEESLWSLDVLASKGYRYDSSIVPTRRPRYGIASWPDRAVRVQLGHGVAIVEVPIGTIAALRREWPLGGGYIRLLPRVALLPALRRASVPTESPVFYCHPYELDAAEFAASATSLPLRVKLHQGLGRRNTAKKLRLMLGTFRCVSVEQSLSNQVLPVIERTLFQSTPGAGRPPAFRSSPIGTKRTQLGPNGLVS
jgi:polysaccharide deacetylase family protein (PEP-CTERM system associated)